MCPVYIEYCTHNSVPDQAIYFLHEKLPITPWRIDNVSCRIQFDGVNLDVGSRALEEEYRNIAML